MIIVLFGYTLSSYLVKAIQHGNFLAVVVIHTEVKAVILTLFLGLLAFCSASFSWEIS